MIGTIGSWSSKFFFFIAPSLFLHQARKPAPFITLSHLHRSSRCYEAIFLGHWNMFHLDTFDDFECPALVSSILHPQSESVAVPQISRKSHSAPLVPLGDFHSESWRGRMHMDAQGLSSWYMSIQELPRCCKCAKKLFIASYVTFFGVKNKVCEVYEAPLKRKLQSLLLVTSVTSCGTMFVLINHIGICLILNIRLRRNLYREFPASEFPGESA